MSTSPARPRPPETPGEGPAKPEVSAPVKPDTEIWRPSTAPTTGPATAAREPSIGPSPGRPLPAPAEPALPGMEGDQKAALEGDQRSAAERERKAPMEEDRTAAAEAEQQEGDDARG